MRLGRLARTPMVVLGFLLVLLSAFMWYRGRTTQDVIEWRHGGRRTLVQSFGGRILIYETPWRVADLVFEEDVDTLRQMGAQIFAAGETIPSRDYLDPRLVQFPLRGGGKVQMKRSPLRYQKTVDGTRVIAIVDTTLQTSVPAHIKRIPRLIVTAADPRSWRDHWHHSIFNLIGVEFRLADPFGSAKSRYWLRIRWPFIAVVGAVPIVVWIVAVQRARRRKLAGCCRHCGYDLRASPERCPECGTPVPARPNEQATIAND